MWLLTFIPDSIIHGFVNTIFYIGLVCSILGFVLNFRWFANYRMILQVVGVLALAAGLYFKGGYEVEMKWRARAAELQAKVDAAEVKSKEVNTVIQERVVTKFKRVKEVQVQNREVIKEVEHIINAECTVPKAAIEILNAAARNEPFILDKGDAK